MKTDPTARGFASSPLSRRGFLLGGAGVMLALPALEMFLPRRTRAAEGDKPKRLIFVFAPNGMHMPSWTPAATGADWSSPTLDDLGDMKAQALVISGLANRPGQPQGAGDHGAGSGAFLTCRSVHKTEGDDIRNGVSVDQMAAAAIGQGTRYPSIELGLEGGAGLGGCDSGYSCAYTRNIAWAGESTPLPKVTNPQVVFDRLFAGYDPNETAAVRDRRKRQNKSILDWVRGDANRLMSRVGAADKQKLDEYLTGIRGLEDRLEQSQDTVCETTIRPTDSYDIEAQFALMSDLMVTAFRCDLTRVSTLMLANGGSGRSYTFVDPSVTGGHHDISHHQDDPENFRKLEIINRWEVRKMAELARKLHAEKDAEGESLLDRTAIYLSSEISDGNSHAHTDLPVLLLGGLGGELPRGHITRAEPMANLFVALLAAVGVDVASFGDDSTGRLSFT